MPIDITTHPDGCILRVRAQPSAKKAGVLGEHDGALKVAVTAPAQDGRANAALLEQLREVLGLKRSQIELISGETSREKRFLIRGLSVDDLRQRVASY